MVPSKAASSAPLENPIKLFFFPKPRAIFSTMKSLELETSISLARTENDTVSNRLKNGIAFGKGLISNFEFC